MMLKKIFLIVFLLFNGLLLQAQLPSLTPRPAAVIDIQQPLMLLNGQWQFSNGMNGKVSTIAVPGEWEMQGHFLKEGDTAMYTRSFTVPADWKGQLVKLRFDGVSSWGEVWINGQKVVAHEGGFVPFEADITPQLQPGENKVQVLVKALTISDRLGCVSQYAVHTVGGILRKVTLFAVPVAHINRLYITPRFSDSRYRNGDLMTDIAVTNANGHTQLQFTLRDAQGKTVLQKKVAVGMPVVLEAGKVQPWTPEIPYLYTLEVALQQDGITTEKLVQLTGFRQVEIKDGVLLVNGMPVKLRGVNRHETHPLLGRSLTPALCRQDAALFKAANCNYIRTSHYPPSEEFLEAADELGLFVESESAITWIQHGASPIWRSWNYLDEKYLPFFIQANVDKMQAGYNHPAIIIWSLANESYWSPLFAKVLAVVKSMDSSRVTTFHDQCWGGFNNGGSKADIAVYHYPGLNGAAATDTMKRPVLFGEYAHISDYNRRELATDPGIRSAYGAPLVQMYDSIFHHSKCLGGAIWSGIDDIFHMPDGRIVGYGPWGPIDGWRRPKPEYYGMKKAYAPVVITNLQNPEHKGNVLLLRIENRFDFTNLQQTTVKSVVDGVEKVYHPAIAPHRQGILRVPVNAAAGPVLITFTDVAGNVVNEEKVSRLDWVTRELSINYPLSVTENEATYQVHQGVNEYKISKLTGVILSASKDGKEILSQGPVFSVVPANEEDGGKPNVAGETYQNNIWPLKNYPLYTLFTKDLTVKQQSHEIVAEMNVTYTNASGKIKYHFSDVGEVKINYEIHYKGEDTIPRQYGLLMELPATFGQLSWQRNGAFTTYPADDISRNEGSAQLHARSIDGVEVWGEQPKGPWKDDANELGSNDFRATRRHIRWAALQDDQQQGIRVTSDGKGQAVRCWLQDQHLQMLIADYSNNGSEPFYGSPHSNGKINIKGKTLQGSITFSLF
ncbi:beta galactosidase small subunit [Chitinophaga niastensis]|uniref:beta-galactosidase n=2 Tax=Chitinophaga niastensis TaxID=536980 RepID=A0A2P8HNI0_CHINA|nr:beta galactosidase small subunit [Chitinophaga niastensis]